MYVHAIMKAMSPPGYHHNGFLAMPGLGHMMYHCMIVCADTMYGHVVITERAHYFHDCMYIASILLL